MRRKARQEVVEEPVAPVVDKVLMSLSVQILLFKIIH